MDGIDLSNNNPGFDQWEGVAFAILKVTEATGFVDQLYGGFAQAALDRGIPFGGYHFAHPDKNSAAAEAQHFLNHYQPRGGMPAAVDIESRDISGQHYDPLAIMGAQSLAAWIDEWCSIVASATGLDPYEYITRSYANALRPWSVRWPLWLATLDGSMPTVWGDRRVAIVQHAIVDGIDRNTMFDAPAPIKPQEETVQATYVKRVNDDGVFVLTSAGATHRVASFGDTEEVFARTLGVVFVNYASTTPITDGAGITRDVWEVSDQMADALGLARAG